METATALRHVRTVPCTQCLSILFELARDMQAVPKLTPPAVKPSFQSPGEAAVQPAAVLRANGKKVKQKKTEPPLKINKAKTTFACLEGQGRIVRAKQGRTYWNGMCFPPAVPGKRRTAKMLWTPWEAASGAVGMLPPNTTPAEMQDWLGFQQRSVALWLNGECRQNDQRLPDIEPTDVTQEGHDTFVLEHEGTRLTIWRDGVKLRAFDNVPADWCFAAGGFGGKVRLMRENDDAGGFVPRIRLSDIVAYHVPDGDMGAGGSDAFVQFELLDEAGELLNLSNGRPCMAHTETIDEASETATFEGAIAVPVPETFTSGALRVTLLDDDIGENADDALGVATMPISFSTETNGVEKMVLEGCLQPGGAGYRFTDSEISFKVDFKGVFA